jgi:hypothetical protein
MQDAGPRCQQKSTIGHKRKQKEPDLCGDWSYHPCVASCHTEFSINYVQMLPDEPCSSSCGCDLMTAGQAHSAANGETLHRWPTGKSGRSRPSCAANDRAVLGSLGGGENSDEGSLMSTDQSDRAPARSGGAQRPAASSRADIEAFLNRVRAIEPALKSGERGRLIFALDATMSRQPTWDQACNLQAEMFREASTVGGLDLQLVYYRGLAECRASGWVAEPDRFGALMSRIDCRGGQTQIAKVLAHARRENERCKVGALVFVGDAAEENLDELCESAGELGLRGIPAFMFQEGDDPVCERAFREIARLSRGAYCRFTPGAAHELSELLRAAAAYAAGGKKALTALQGRSTRTMRLIEQLG